jgi:hypothetical protein
MTFKERPPRAPDPDRQEGGEHQVMPSTRTPDTMLPPESSLAGQGKLIAPRGRFRVVGVDTFSGPYEDYLIGDCADKDEAVAIAAKHGRRLNPCYVFDSNGRCIFSAGSPS